jgi:hypothetical protein
MNATATSIGGAMASSKEIQLDIDRLEAELGPMYARLDSLITEFGRELVPEVDAWMKSELIRRVEANADAVNKAGIDALRAAKVDLNGLLERLPQLCEEAVGTQATWPHHQGRQSYFADAFRSAINYLGEVLERHGLIMREKPGHMATWDRVAGGGFRYTINPGFDGKNFKSVSEYTELRARQEKLAIQLNEMRTKLAKAQAKELWDQA